MNIDNLVRFSKDERPDYRTLADHIHKCIVVDPALNEVIRNLKSYKYAWNDASQEDFIDLYGKLTVSIDYGSTGIAVKASVGKAPIAEIESWSDEYSMMLSMGKLLGAIRYYFNGCIYENWNVIENNERRAV